jgi:hypothetical protein
MLGKVKMIANCKMPSAKCKVQVASWSREIARFTVHGGGAGEEEGVVEVLVKCKL